MLINIYVYTQSYWISLIQIFIFQAHIKLAETGLKCLCELLIAHPYFNFSKNIIHLLVPFLNSGRENIREMISACIRGVFKADKRGNVSLDVCELHKKWFLKELSL